MISNSGAHDVYNVPKRFVDLHDIEKCQTSRELPRIFSTTNTARISTAALCNTGPNFRKETRHALPLLRRVLPPGCSLWGAPRRVRELQDRRIILLWCTRPITETMRGSWLWMKGVLSFSRGLPCAGAHSVAPIHQVKRKSRVDAFVEHVDFRSRLFLKPQSSRFSSPVGKEFAAMGS